MKLVRYTVHSIVGSLVETTSMAGPQTWAVGTVRAESVGDDGSTYSWPLVSGDPQPVVGSVFVREVKAGVRGRVFGTDRPNALFTVAVDGAAEVPEVGTAVTVTVNP